MQERGQLSPGQGQNKSTSEAVLGLLWGMGSQWDHQGERSGGAP